MTKTAWMEPLSSIIRIGDEGAKHLDPYHFCTTIRYLNYQEAEVCGVCKTVTNDDWRAMMACFSEHGLKKVLYQRINRGRVREKWLPVPPKKTETAYVCRTCDAIYRSPVACACGCVEFDEITITRKARSNG